jgi:hypothetical protein
MRYIVIGQVGSDAGYWYWDGSHWRHVGGWGPDALAELRNALSIVQNATKFRTPGLADAATKAVAEFAAKAVNEHIGDAAKGPVTILMH